MYTHALPIPPIPLICTSCSWSLPQFCWQWSVAHYDVSNQTPVDKRTQLIIVYGTVIKLDPRKSLYGQYSANHALKFTVHLCFQTSFAHISSSFHQASWQSTRRGNVTCKAAVTASLSKLIEKHQLSTFSHRLHHLRKIGYGA